MTITYGDIGIYLEQGYTYNGDVIGTVKSKPAASSDAVVRKASDVWRTK